MSRILITLAVVSGLFLGCTKKPAAAPEEHEVNLSIWGNYLSPEMKAKFEKESGIKINISNYSSNEELLAKVQMGSSGIDVAVPSDYMVEIMAKMGLLEPLKNDEIPNKAGVSEQFLKQSFDPENKFSLPYTWTSTGIAYNKELYKGEMKSWKDLLENKDLKGKFALLDDVRETTGAALKMTGASVNSTKAVEVQKAKDVLLTAKKNVKMFTSDTIDILKNKEVVAAQAYSSDALQAAAQAPGKIAYVLPTEGGTYAIDNLVVLKGAHHPAAAHKLINFLLSKEAEIAKVKSIYGGPILKDIRKDLPKDIQDNPVLFPETAAFQKLEHVRDLGAEGKMYEDLWTEVKTK
ncbi:MAG: spermidine/putrescine ABC transporter substrate-binding protein [Bdellovibrionales bacterium]|nr:spermidine/putrescine ABC transporter substrate-binding protein [Bdellovibrionales bacterium]